MAGRKPKPTHLKLMQGTDRPDRILENEASPAIPTELPEPPDFLDEAGQKEWYRTGEELLTSGILSRIDLTALAAYCEQYSAWIEATRMVRKHGTVIKMKTSDYLMLSPYLSVQKQAFTGMTRMLSEFGMTPSSRTRVRGDAGGSPPGGEYGDFDSFVRERNGKKGK